MSEIKAGQKVRFSIGRAKTTFEATVTGRDGVFLLTKDDAGKERKVRAGACVAI